MGDRTQDHSPLRPAAQGEGPEFEVVFQISPASTRYGYSATAVTRSPVRISFRGVPMHPVRRPALIHPAFENTAASSGAEFRLASARAALAADGSRADSRCQA